MCDIMAKPWKVLALLNIALVAADVQVYPKSDPFILLADFYDEEANFGVDIPKRGLSTGVVVASNEYACGPIDPPPTVPNPPSHWAVLIRRYNCSFEEKVLNAQSAFYDVAIVHNVDSNKLEIMNASHPELIHIMAIFISANTGREIRTKYLYEQGFVVRIEPNSAGDILGKILIPFIVVISSCFVLMVGFMVVKCIKDHRRNRRRRMPYSTLNKIPTTKYRKNDPYETCAICLDDFIEGEKLRVLPCSHAYHCKCIDPWLTRNRRVCPMCKRKVFAADERVETDGSSSEDDDHTPLLRGRNAPANNTSYSRRVAMLRAEHMRHVLDTINRGSTSQNESRERSGSNSSDGSSYSTPYIPSSTYTEVLQECIQRMLGGDDVRDPNREDHHSQLHPSRDSGGASGSLVHPESQGSSKASDGNHSASHDDVGSSLHHDTAASGHHEETSHSHYETASDSHHDVVSDSHYDASDSHYDASDSHHDVAFSDDYAHDHSYSHDYDC